MPKLQLYMTDDFKARMLDDAKKRGFSSLSEYVRVAVRRYMDPENQDLSPTGETGPEGS